jgi:lysyl-tRNA synthetase class 2
VSSPPDNFEASRTDKLQRIEQLGIDPWGGRFDGHQPIRDILALPADKPEGERPRVRAAGRVIGKRGQGKLFFLDIWDWTTPNRTNKQGQERRALQVMIGKKQVDQQSWDLIDNIDFGDLIGVEGPFAETKMGEPTILAEKLHFLAKSLQPHPDKWAGMQEMEYRLRHRYLDLIYTPETLERTLKRVKIVRTIRTYLEKEGYLEVETPTLHAIAGGAAARPFITHHNTLDIDLYLRIALELHLKRLLVGGIEKVYEIGRVFRNEGISPKHNPEFTMMELYQAYGDYQTMMELTEGLIVACVDCLGGDGGRQLPYGDTTINFAPPWQRLSYGEAFREHVGVDMNDQAAVAKVAPTKGIHTQILNEQKQPIGAKDHDVIVHELFEECIEDKLAGPVFVYDYPAGLCPLTKRKKGNPAIAERFELYVHGMELANAYTELNDPITQEATFRQQLAGLAEEESMAKMDEDFVRALRHGMPPAGGLGIGIDRLVMLLTNTTTIRDVILFPLLRPEK